MTKQPLVSCPLFDLVKAIIGDDVTGIEYCEIEPTLGVVLSEALKDFSATAVVAWNDFDGEKLPRPRLWNGRHYREFKRIHESQRDFKHKQRVIWNIRQANTDELMRVLTKERGMNEDVAKGLCVRLMRSGGYNEAMKVLGMEKWITKEEELT